MLLKIDDDRENQKKILKLYIMRTDDKKIVEFVNLTDENGEIKTIRCSNVQMIAKLQ
jgi:hypothetical protein